MKYFTINELTQTTHGDNIPNEEQKKALETLVEKILDPVRIELDAPIKVTSGFRSIEVNKAVGGASSSQHLRGEAADLTCFDNKKLFRLLIDMEFDQLIYEFGNDEQPSWVHVSYHEGKNRNQVLRAIKSGGKTKYINYK